VVSAACYLVLLIYNTVENVKNIFSSHNVQKQLQDGLGLWVRLLTPALK
jgi:hypothetical protein